jgi:hypothetical protein
MSWKKFENPLHAALSEATTSARSDQEVRGLIATPDQARGLLTCPAAAPEQDPTARMDLIQGPLQAVAVKAAKRPRRLGAGTSVVQPSVIGDVEAVAIIGLDALNPELEYSLG